MVEVMDSFESSISLDKKITKTINKTIIDNGIVEIDNRGCELSYPKFTFTGSATISGAFLMQDGNEFLLDVSIGSGDELILDFSKQDYRMNGELINDFSIDELIHLPANDITEIEISCSGELEVEVSYPSYEVGNDLHYVEGWDFNTKFSHSTVKPFNSKKTKSSRVEEVNYNFTIEKMTTNFDIYNSIENGDKYRITYTEYNPDTYEGETKYLVGVRFNQFRRSFQMGEFIISNISGEFNDILTKNY